MHAVASLLPVPTCTCGLTFATAGLLTAHITAALTTDSGSGISSGTTPASTPAPPADPRPLATICQTSGCGHPLIAHGDRGPRCRIMLSVAGRYCPCTAFT